MDASLVSLDLRRRHHARFFCVQGGKNAKQDPAYGADVLRLWVASVDYNSDVLIGGRILSQVTCLDYQLSNNFLYQSMTPSQPRLDVLDENSTS